MPLLRNTLIYFLLTIISLILESVVEFDRFFQQPFFENGKWLISPEFHAEYKWLFYTGVKVCIIIFTTGLFLYSIYCIYSKKDNLSKWIKPSLLAVSSIAAIPLIISILKAITGVYAPNDLIPYGGKNEHIGFLLQLYTYGHPAGGRCFPAGHASGGFALMSLSLLPVSNRSKKILLLLGLIVGWSMGLYQMARGEHFISHTLFTMFFALSFISFLKDYFINPHFKIID